MPTATCPAILVAAPASGQGKTTVAGVLANRVASSGHAEMLKVSLRDPEQWQGALMRDAAVSLPERHLGLVMSTELTDAHARLEAAADALAETPLGQKSADALQAEGEALYVLGAVRTGGRPGSAVSVR